jgi:hypothetical protein
MNDSDCQRLGSLLLPKSVSVIFVPKAQRHVVKRI